MSDPTHTISMRVTVAGEDQFSEVWQTFNLLANGLGRRFHEVNISSHLVERYEEDPEDKSYETYTEDTLDKVSVALREAGVSDRLITEAISMMQNYGILFRENVK